MLSELNQLDTRLFLLINGWHGAWADQLMMAVSGKWMWLPLYAYLLWRLYNASGKQFYWTLLAIALMIASSDQLCNFFKETTMRLRPSQEPALASMVHLVNGYSGGMYGFFSAHAANTFAVVAFALEMLSGRPKFLRWALPVFGLLVGYSRIYLGVHYPGDVLVGMVAGASIGGMYALLLKSFTQGINNRKALQKPGRA